MDVKLRRQIGFAFANGTELLVTAQSRTPCPGEGGGTPGVASHPGFPLAQNRHYAIK